jgi:hypothetical protein
VRWGQECELPAYPFAAATRLPIPWEGLDPPEGFLDAHSLELADLVAGVSHGAPIESAPTPARIVCRDARSGAEFTHPRGKRRDVVFSVGSDGNAMIARLY